MARLLGWEWQVKRMLGLPSKLPSGLIHFGVVNGVEIEVHQQSTRRDTRGIKQPVPFHRVFATCPECNMTLSAGRLNQHWNKVHPDKPWPRFEWNYDADRPMTQEEITAKWGDRL